MSAPPAPDRGETLAAALDRTFATHAARVAIIEHGEELTYAELERGAEPYTRALLALGVEKGDRVSVLLPNCVEWLYLLAAVARAGAVMVPVNNRYRPGEIETLFRSSKPRVVFSADEFMSNSFLDRIAEIVPELVDAEPGAWQSERFPELEHVVAMGSGRLAGMIPHDEFLAGAEKVTSDDVARRQAEVGTRDPLYIFYTSGSTGEPKGVVVPNDAVVNLQDYYAALGLTADDIVHCPMPLSYIGGHFMGFLGSLLAGSTAVIGHQFDIEEIVDLLLAHRVTFFGTVPPMWTQLTYHPRLVEKGLPDVRTAFVAGQTFTPAQLQLWSDGLGLRTFITGYGMTETLGGATTTAPDDAFEVAASTIGRPLPCFEFKLLDPATQEPVVPGEPGELWVRGKIMLRYHGMSDEELARYVDPDGWFQTGDLLAERPDGNYAYVARLKDMIKVAGENASGPQVEADVGRHPDILEVAVVGVPDERRGEAILAYVRRVDGSTLTIDELRTWCKGEMAPHKVPQHVVWLDDPDAWPRTVSGKTSKPELRRRFLEGS